MSGQRCTCSGYQQTPVNGLLLTLTNTYFINDWRPSRGHRIDYLDIIAHGIYGLAIMNQRRKNTRRRITKLAHNHNEQSPSSECITYNSAIKKASCIKLLSVEMCPQNNTTVMRWRRCVLEHELEVAGMKASLTHCTVMVVYSIQWLYKQPHRCNSVWSLSAVTVK